jgi:hypothetical protein
MAQSPTQAKQNNMWVGLIIVAILFFSSLTCVHMLITEQLYLPDIFGERQTAMFDLWSCQHFIFGIIIGSFLLWQASQIINTWYKLVLVMFLVALCWESTELALEYGLFGQAFSEWKLGFEHWGNRFVADPIMVVSGSLVAKKYDWAWKAVIVPCVFWQVANMLAPHSMCIQQWLTY